MANVFKLDDIRTEAVRRYEPTEIELSDGSVVRLRSLLRLGEKDRKQVLAIVAEINEVNDDEETDEEFALELVSDSIAQIIGMIANKPKKLLADLDHEDPIIKAHMHSQVLSAWMRGTQLGEAESSPA